MAVTSKRIKVPVLKSCHGVFGSGSFWQATLHLPGCKVLDQTAVVDSSMLILLALELDAPSSSIQTINKTLPAVWNYLFWANIRSPSKHNYPMLMLFIQNLLHGAFFRTSKRRETSLRSSNGYREDQIAIGLDESRTRRFPELQMKVTTEKQICVTARDQITLC